MLYAVVLVEKTHVSKCYFLLVKTQVSKKKICNFSCPEFITYNLMSRNGMKIGRNVHNGYKVMIC